jgi:hypothetical protein
MRKGLVVGVLIICKGIQLTLGIDLPGVCPGLQLNLRLTNGTLFTFFTWILTRL